MQDTVEPLPETAAPDGEEHPDPDEDALTKLDPAYAKALRLTAIITAIPFLIGALILELAGALPLRGIVIVPIVLLLAFLIIRVPLRRYHARGYDHAADRLRVVRGILFRSDTVVPFGRVQHIDVDQGPIERFYDIATLTLHTAGNHNSSVNLPGLKHATALEMRETIRAAIKRDTM